MKPKAGNFLAYAIQWAWDCGLEIQSTHKRMFQPGFNDPTNIYGYNQDLAMRNREQCWPVIRFTHPGTNRSEEVCARDWVQMEHTMENVYKSIFAELGCPEWKPPSQSERGE